MITSEIASRQLVSVRSQANPLKRPLPAINPYRRGKKFFCFASDHHDLHVKMEPHQCENFGNQVANGGNTMIIAINNMTHAMNGAPAR